ncbi:MAG: peptidoglycan editing factor PgeF [Candidatus Wolfebacteria bacterium]|nr:peptidoglycan editing factor PgeF [Candidatus Wolfebacteria bacterium]
MFITDDNNISIFASLKSDGDMLFKKDYPELNGKIRADRISFFNKNNIDPARLANFAGIHGNNISKVSETDLGGGSLEETTRIRETDGLITNIKNSYLMITGADCFPVMFWDENAGIIGAVHAGWRGIIKEIIPKMINKFTKDFDSDLSGIKVWVGPGIKSHHYPIDEERIALFSKNHKNNIITKDGKAFLDLTGVILDQLQKARIPEKNIEIHPDCTFCEEDKYFSHRRDKSEPIEANAFIVHLK